MKNALCNGGCKKGDCNGDCKRIAISEKQLVKAALMGKDPQLKKIGDYLENDLLVAAIKKARKEKHLSKKELGRLVGVKKSQISKIEKRMVVARFDSILKVFKALNVKMHFSFELPDQTMTLR